MSGATEKKLLLPIPGSQMAQARLRGRVAGTAGNRLTPHEVRVLQLISEGRIDREIAEELHLSVHTIRNQSKSVLRKLRARSRAEAVAIGFQRGILGVEERKAG